MKSTDCVHTLCLCASASSEQNNWSTYNRNHSQHVKAKLVIAAHCNLRFRRFPVDAFRENAPRDVLGDRYH